MQENNNAIEDNAAETTEKQEQATVRAAIGIRFRSCGKIYTFAIEDIDAPVGSKVVVESEMGLSIGTAATPKRPIEKSGEQLKKVLRLANEKDFETLAGNRALEEEAKAFCAGRAKELNLAMKVVATETTLDRKRFTFYFTADGRIDFRELVRDLAAKFKSRIEMRQIGVRDEVKLLGGIGLCGRQTCCSLFLTNFEPVTIKMAKRQELSINQSKLSGICGRLMCCLGYECREGREVPESQDEETVTISEEPAETALQEDVSGSQYKNEGLQPVQDTSVSEEQGIRPAQREGAPARQFDREAGKERHSRRDRHRHRRHRPDKSAQSSPVQEKSVPEKPAQEGAAQKTEGEDKGRPFNRRRKFWKKKKHEQK